MFLPFADFDSGFRKLGHSFGTTYNAERAKAYYEHIQHRMGPDEWRIMVYRIVETHEFFPKISTILKMVNDMRPKNDERFDPFQWVDSDCKVKMCNDGLLHYQTPDGVVTFRCPRCNRARVTNTMAVFKGAVSLHSDEEMQRRREEREHLYKTPEYRAEVRRAVLQEAAVIFGLRLEGKHREETQDDSGSGEPF